MLKEIAQKDRNSTVRGYAILSLGDIAVKINRENETIHFLENRRINEKVVFTRIDILAVLYNLGITEHLNNILDLINTPDYQNRCIVIDYLHDIVNNENKDIILKAMLEQKKIEKSRAVVSIIDEALEDIMI